MLIEEPVRTGNFYPQAVGGLRETNRIHALSLSEKASRLLSAPLTGKSVAAR